MNAKRRVLKVLGIGFTALALVAIGLVLLPTLGGQTSVKAQEVAAQAAITITLDGPSEGVVGQIITYTGQLTYTGHLTVAGVRLASDLAGTDVVFTATAHRGSFSPEDTRYNILRYNAPEYKPGEVVTDSVEITLGYPKPGVTTVRFLGMVVSGTEMVVDVPFTTTWLVKTYLPLVVRNWPPITVNVGCSLVRPDGTCQVNQGDSVLVTVTNMSDAVVVFETDTDEKTPWGWLYGELGAHQSMSKMWTPQPDTVGNIVIWTVWKTAGHQGYQGQVDTLVLVCLSNGKCP